MITVPRGSPSAACARNALKTVVIVTPNMRSRNKAWRTRSGSQPVLRQHNGSPQPCVVRGNADVVAATHPQSNPILLVSVAIDDRPALPPTYRHMVQPVFDLDAQWPSHAVYDTGNNLIVKT